MIDIRCSSTEQNAALGGQHAKNSLRRGGGGGGTDGNKAISQWDCLDVRDTRRMPNQAIGSGLAVLARPPLKKVL